MATVAQIKADLTKKVGVAMEMVKQEVCDIFVRVVRQYYGEFKPSWYIRTYQIAQQAAQMANAAVKVRQIGASFEVYFDSAVMNHKRGSWTEEMILSNVMTSGDHGGASDGGTAVWTEAMGILNPKIKQIVKKELVAAGIPVH